MKSPTKRIAVFMLLALGVLLDSASTEPLTLTLETTSVRTIAGTASTKGYVDGLGSRARFNEPRGITSDGTFLYVADTGNHVIRKLDTARGIVSSFAELPYAGCMVAHDDHLIVAPTRGPKLSMIDVETAQIVTPQITADCLPSHELIGAVGGLASDGRYLYVNRGLGYARRMNLNGRPEITLFTLQPAETAP